MRHFTAKGLGSESGERLTLDVRNMTPEGHVDFS